MPFCLGLSGNAILASVNSVIGMLGTAMMTWMNGIAEDKLEGKARLRTRHAYKSKLNQRGVGHDRHVVFIHLRLHSNKGKSYRV